MELNHLSLPRTKHGSSSLTLNALPRPAELFETGGDPEPGVQTELRREKARLKLVLEVTKQAVSNREVQDVVSAVMMTIRNGVLCDGVCICLESPEGEELRVHALDFAGDADFQEGTTIPLSGTIAGHVVQTARPWCGSREEACEHFPRQLLLAPGFTTGCMLPISGRHSVLGTLGLVRRENNSFTEDEIDFLTQISKQIAVGVESALVYQQIRELKEKLAQESADVDVDDEMCEIGDESNFDEIVGKSAALRRILAQVQTVAPTDSTVLIYGETGTGKELVARAIHNLSSRHSNAFVKLNCAAIPTGLLESELFGHEKGAFTGAIAQRIGRFELATRGTVFLDEVGEVPLELQTKLLRVLQEREFERLGSTRTIRTDARLIAATNRDLSAMVEAKEFRADLFYRVNVFPVHVPPLRERPDDIPLLVSHFVQQFARHMRKTIETIPSDTMQRLLQYPWPGNIRELQNVLERAVILSPGPVLQVPLTDLTPHRTPARSTPDATLAAAERTHILAVLEETGWVLGGPHGAAARLGLKRSTLQFRLRKLGLTRPGR